MDGFEALLTGGHPNSLGRTLEVVEAVGVDRSRLAELYHWAVDDPALDAWLKPHARRLVHDGRKSVASNARKLLDQIGGRERDE